MAIRIEQVDAGSEAEQSVSELFCVHGFPPILSV